MCCAALFVHTVLYALHTRSVWACGMLVAACSGVCVCVLPGAVYKYMREHVWLFRDAFSQPRLGPDLLRAEPKARPAWWLFGNVG